MKKLIAVNANGRVIGQSSPTAKYLDREIELVIYLYEQGMTQTAIANKMEMPLTTVHYIVKGKIRASLPACYKGVKDDKKERG